MSQRRPPRSGEINIQSDTPLALPSREAEERLAMRRSDWRRVRKRVERLCHPTLTESTWTATCIATGVTSLLALVPIVGATSSADPWVIPTVVVVSVGSFVLALLIQRLPKELAGSRLQEIKDICQEMDEIEATYENRVETANEMTAGAKENLRERARIGRDRVIARRGRLLDLVETKSLSMSEIARELGSSLAAVLSDLEALEREGKVLRVADEPRRWRAAQTST